MTTPRFTAFSLVNFKKYEALKHKVKELSQDLKEKEKEKTASEKSNDNQISSTEDVKIIGHGCSQNEDCNECERDCESAVKDSNNLPVKTPVPIIENFSQDGAGKEGKKATTRSRRHIPDKVLLRYVHPDSVNEAKTLLGTNLGPRPSGSHFG